MHSDTLQRAEALIREKSFEACLDLLQPLVEQDGTAVELHKPYAEALFSLQEYEQALPSLQLCLKTWGVECDYGLFLKARTAIEKSRRSRDEKLAFWVKCTDETSKVLEGSLQAVLAGDQTLALEEFQRGCISLFPIQDVVDVWVNSLAKIIDASQGKFEKREIQKSHVQKIIVSGYGWSGSGALYDFFSEFEHASPIKLEALHLESAIGFRSIVSSTNAPDDYLSAVLDFFFRTLLGRGEIRNANYFNTYEKSLRIRRRQEPLTYAQNVNHLSDIIVQGFTDLEKVGQVSQETLSLLADETVNRIVIGTGMVGKIFVLDNIIHVGNARLVTYLKNTSMFCTFRDPRSNFVSRKREDRGFALSAREFAEQRRKMMPGLEQELKETFATLPDSENVRVFRVTFEEFVLSEKYRNSLVAELGFDLGVQEKHSIFKPWESIRNVTLHQEHDPSEDIRLIAEVLPEYCVEPSVAPLSQAGCV